MRYVSLIALGAAFNVARAAETIPEPSVTSIGDFYIALKAVAQWVLVFGMILGVLFIIMGAISILTSRGDEKKLTTGKDTITWAIVGVVLLVLSYAIVNIVAKFFGVSGTVISP
ncbi:MAG: hypothetical protein Q7S09_05690 [bacterium]|nr:hypothetical protein [bacterium]